LSVHISMVLSIRSAPPQSRAPLRSKGAHFEKRCSYGLPCLLGEVHSRMALLLHRALESRILSMQISMVLSIRSIPPQSRAHLRSKFAFFSEEVPLWAAMSARRSPQSYGVAASWSTGNPEL
jgi:hypothetical protein